MEFRLLGPFGVVGDGGRTLQIGAGRQRALLALLVPRSNELVTADRLVDELWGQAAAATAHQMLHNQIPRCVVRSAGTGGWRRAVAGYRLNVGADERDVRPLRGAGRARTVADGGRADDAAAAFRQALALWRGTALSGFAYQPFAQAEIARLEERRVAAFEGAWSGSWR